MKPFDSIIRTALLPLLLCVPLISGAQSRDEIVSDPRYISGEGTGSTFREADNAALSLITDQIAVAVNSDLTIRQTSGREGKNRTASSTFESVVNTYSQATLTMCARIVLENGPKRYRILRYISLEELGRIFTGREDKIVEMLKIAEKAERELKIADALKYTYWSGLLLSTLPYPNELHYTSAKDGEVLASAWIPAKINDMLGRITVSFGGYDSGSRILGKLVFLDGDVKVSVNGKIINIKLPSFTVENLDNNGEGLTPTQLTVEIMGKLAKQVTVEVAAELAKEGLQLGKDVGNDAANATEGAAKDLKKSVESALKDLFN